MGVLRAIALERDLWCLGLQPQLSPEKAPSLQMYGCDAIMSKYLSTETPVHERTAADMCVRWVKTARKMERAKEG